MIIFLRIISWRKKKSSNYICSRLFTVFTARLWRNTIKKMKPHLPPLPALGGACVPYPEIPPRSSSSCPRSNQWRPSPPPQWWLVSLFSGSCQIEHCRYLGNVSQKGVSEHNPTDSRCQIYIPLRCNHSLVCFVASIQWRLSVHTLHLSYWQLQHFPHLII